MILRGVILRGADVVGVRAAQVADAEASKSFLHELEACPSCDPLVQMNGSEVMIHIENQNADMYVDIARRVEAVGNAAELTTGRFINRIGLAEHLADH